MELLIALGLTGLVSVAIFKVYNTQHQHYFIQDQLTDVQQNARASLDEITRQVRMAGFGLPTGLNALRASNANPDSLVVIYRADTCQGVLSANMASAGANMLCTGSVGGFAPGEWAYIFEPDSGGGEFFVISGLDTSANQISHNPLSKAYRKDAIVLVVSWAQYYINTADSNHPTLIVSTPANGAQAYADDITDLQFQYRLSNGTIVDVPPLVEDVREVIVSVTGRSHTVDPFKTGDQYRYRTYKSSINVRNLGG
jgi:hypothetical protein